MNLWSLEKKSIAKIATGVVGSKCEVLDMDMPDQIGYTTKEKKIFLAEEHKIMDGLDRREKKFFRLGVAAHEILHLLFSDFSIIEKMYSSLPHNEFIVYKELFNLVEDPAIEYHAPLKIGGKILKALRFMIQYVYKKSPSIDGQKGFTQYANALIHFGDMGIIKGNFTDPLAAEVFSETAELFNKGVESNSSKERSDIALQLMEKSRILWEKEMPEELQNEMNELMKNSGKSNKETCSSDSEIDFSGTVSGNDGGACRKKIIKVLKKMKKTSSDKTTKDMNCDVKDSSFEFEELSEEKLDENTDMTINDDSFNFEEDTTSDSLDADLNNSDKLSENDLNDLNESIHSEENEIKEIDITEEDISWMNDLETKIQENLEKEKAEEQEYPIDKSIQPSFYEKGKYSNQDIEINIKKSEINSFEIKYNEVLDKYSGIINNYVRFFKNLFHDKRASKIHKTSGKVNVQRFYNPRLTSRVFDRRTEPNDLGDLAVMVLVDESGSMDSYESGQKRYSIARDLTICLSETFHLLNIPTYVMGFSADQYASSDHFHYVKWKNTKMERMKLLQIKGRFNNFDSQSISYATEILKKRREMHKLLIVISDGTPLCSTIDSQQGIADTKEAIRIAKNDMDVLGLAIGNSSTETIMHMYEKNFFHITDASECVNDVANEVIKIAKSWR